VAGFSAVDPVALKVPRTAWGKVCAVLVVPRQPASRPVPVLTSSLLPLPDVCVCPAGGAAATLLTQGSSCCGSMGVCRTWQQIYSRYVRGAGMG
jgi:hypothetical protein